MSREGAGWIKKQNCLLLAINMQVGPNYQPFTDNSSLSISVNILLRWKKNNKQNRKRET